jgi:hypothetical protein
VAEERPELELEPWSQRLQPTKPLPLIVTGEEGQALSWEETWPRLQPALVGSFLPPFVQMRKVRPSSLRARPGSFPLPVLWVCA